MQSFTEIPSNEVLTVSRTSILNNEKTIMSNSSGTAFPTTNLQIGMICDRTDLQCLYKLVDMTPTWKLVFDYSKTATNKEYVDTQIGTRVPNDDVVTIAQANKILKLDANAKLPASITGGAATAAALSGDRTIQLTGGVTGTQVWDGSGGLTIETEVGTHQHTMGDISDLSLGHGIQIFTASGTFTVPAGVNTLFITCCGGGAGGRKTTQSSYGGGAGGSGYVVSAKVNITPGEQVIVTVGAGGVQDTAGGISSFGTYVSASGGGIGNAANGTGGVGFYNGGRGSFDDNEFGIQATDGGGLFPGVRGTGSGSGNYYGGGGASTGFLLFGYDQKFSTDGGNGDETNERGGKGGYGYGAGGGGGAANYPTHPNGGSGAPGIVVVEW